MKKTIGLLLCAMLMLTGSALADQQIATGAILKVEDNGNLLCESIEGYRFSAIVSGDTAYAMAETPEPGMIVDIKYTAPDTEAAPNEIVAAAVRDAVYEGTVTAVDADSSRVQISTNNAYSVWVLLPKTTDIPALEGQNIRFTPYTTQGTPFREGVEARDFTLYNAVCGTVAGIAGDKVTLDTHDGQVQLTLTDDTLLYHPLEEGGSVSVHYPADESVDAGTLDPLSIWICNG